MLKVLLIVMALEYAIILVHELLSIIENAERLGIPVPDWLKNLLQNIKEKNQRDVQIKRILPVM